MKKPMETVPTEARGRLRVFKSELQHHADAITRMWQRMQAEAEEIVTRPLVGRIRVFERLAKRLAPHARLWDVHLEGKAPLALWAYLKPRDGVVVDPEDPAQMQDCISVDYLLAGAVLGPKSHGVASGLWTTEASDHALGRFLARHPRASLSDMLFDAHRSALSLPVAALQACMTPGTEARIAAGDGLLFAELIYGPDLSADFSHQIHFRGKTWVHRDQLRPEQDAMPVGEAGKRTGDSWLRPLPLRVLEEQDQSYHVAVPEWAVGFGTSSEPRH